MDLRNNIFAAAFDELKRNHGIKTQKELARRMGVNENTITRILKGYTEVTEDIITKLQTASGCIFNLQWLRGEDPYHMLAEDVPKPTEPQPQSAPPVIDQSSMVNAIIATYEGRIADLKESNADLRSSLKQKDDQIADLRATVDDLRARLADLRNELQNINRTDLDYPFPVGAAEHKKLPKNV